MFLGWWRSVIDSIQFLCNGTEISSLLLLEAFGEVLVQVTALQNLRAFQTHAFKSLGKFQRILRTVIIWFVKECAPDWVQPVAEHGDLSYMTSGETPHC